MRSKYIPTFIILLFTLYSFSSTLSAKNFINDFVRIVENSQNNIFGNRKLTLEAIKRYKETNESYLKTEKVLSYFETSNKPYIYINIIYNYGGSSDSFLLTNDDMSECFSFLRYSYKYPVNIFNNLLSYAIEASDKYIYTGDFSDVTPHSLILLRVFNNKKIYYSVFIEPENVFLKGVNNEVSPESFYASYQFCTFVIYEYLINNTSILLKEVFSTDNFIRFQNRIEFSTK